MKKVKVTKKLKSQSDLILKPARLRMTAIYAVIFVFAMAAGLLIRFVLDGFELDTARLLKDWPVNLAIVAGGSILLVIMDYRRWTLRVLGGERVEGPSGALGERTAFPIKEIDWTRTHRSLDSWLKIGNGIYTQSRQRILISPWFYDPERYREFLAFIGYERAAQKEGLTR